MSAHDDEFSVPSDSAWQPPERRIATTPISTEILREVLGFPDTVEIIGDASGNLNLTVSSELIPEGVTEVVAVWIRRGCDAEPEFRSFDPINLPSEPEKAS
jgi:hypothetical protein